MAGTWPAGSGASHALPELGYPRDNLLRTCASARASCVHRSVSWEAAYGAGMRNKIGCHSSHPLRWMAPEVLERLTFTELTQTLQLVLGKEREATDGGSRQPTYASVMAGPAAPCTSCAFTEHLPAAVDTEF